MIDILAQNVRNAEDHHARLIMSKASEREILVAFRDSLVAWHALSCDSDGVDSDEAQHMTYAIDDANAAIALLDMKGIQ